MLLEIHRIRKPREKKLIFKSEFAITRLFMNILGIESNSDYTIYDGYSDDLIPAPFERGSRTLAYCERYESISKIPMKYNIFRPIFNDYDASLLMDLASEQDLIDFDLIEIKEFTNNKGAVKYKGWLVKDGEIVERSLIKTSPSIPILKCSILAALIMDENEHEKYMDNLYSYLYGERWRQYKPELLKERIETNDNERDEST